MSLSHRQNAEVPAGSSRRSPMTRLYVDGPTVMRAVRAAVANLEAHVEEVDALNVFPVPDGDTGSNMLATMRAALAEAERLPEAQRDLASVADALSRGALTRRPGQQRRHPLADHPGHDRRCRRSTARQRPASRGRPATRLGGRLRRRPDAGRRDDPHGHPGRRRGGRDGCRPAAPRRGRARGGHRRGRQLGAAHAHAPAHPRGRRRRGLGRAGALSAPGGDPPGRHRGRRRGRPGHPRSSSGRRPRAPAPAGLPTPTRTESQALRTATRPSTCSTSDGGRHRHRRAPGGHRGDRGLGRRRRRRAPRPRPRPRGAPGPRHRGGPGLGPAQPGGRPGPRRAGPPRRRWPRPTEGPAARGHRRRALVAIAPADGLAHVLASLGARVVRPAHGTRPSVGEIAEAILAAARARSSCCPNDSDAFLAARHAAELTHARRGRHHPDPQRGRGYRWRPSCSTLARLAGRAVRADDAPKRRPLRSFSVLTAARDSVVDGRARAQGPGHRRSMPDRHVLAQEETWRRGGPGKRSQRSVTSTS